MNKNLEVHGVIEGEYLSADEPDISPEERRRRQRDKAWRNFQKREFEFWKTEQEIKEVYARYAAQKTKQEESEVTLLQCAAFIGFFFLLFLAMFHLLVINNSGT